MAKEITVIVSGECAGMRLDSFCARAVPDLSRERVKSLIQAGGVVIEGVSGPVKPSLPVQAGQAVSIAVPPASDAQPEAEAIALDIVFEDSDLLVINKQAGLVVHPAAGNRTGTLVNALLHHCGASLSGIGGVRRPGIVHRLDKDTSGLMIVAKNDAAHAGLSAQLADRSLSRTYQALVWNVPRPPNGIIDKPIGRDSANRLKKSIRSGGDARPARTLYKTVHSYADALALVECRLETGRTHQIRVHMQSVGCPLVGDPLYGAPPSMQQARIARVEGLDPGVFLNFQRQALYACAIAFVHPVTGDAMRFEQPLPDDMQALIDALERR